MTNINRILKEQWQMMRELYELPNNINTKIRGDDIFNNDYGERFEFVQPVKGNSGKTYNIIFAFLRRDKPLSHKTRTMTVAGKKDQKEVEFMEHHIPLYEVAFYPEEREGTADQWGFLNDVSATEVIALAGFYILHHASELFKTAAPFPLVDYIFRPYKEKAERDKEAKDSKRGALYNRAIPRVLKSLEPKFPDISVTGYEVHPEHTMISVKKA